MNAAAANQQPRWDWPFSVPAATMQRVIDVHAVLALERGPPEFQQAFQELALRRLIDHVQRASPWWRAWLRVAPGQLTLAQLPQLPVLRREDFRAAVEHAGALPIPPDHGQVIRDATSGSTGVAMGFFTTQWNRRITAGHYEAEHVRHRHDLRLPIAVLLARTEQQPGEEHRLEPADPTRGRGPVYHRRSLGIAMDEHARWLARLAPAYLSTHATVLDGMLDAYESGAAQPAQGLRQVLTSSETVWPALRERTQRVLGATIADRYACEEVGLVALQCPTDAARYHVCVANAIVEVVDEQYRPCAEGVPGSVLVTGLHQWASPSVRYEVGDIAALHATCSCGERVPSLSGLLGRKRFLVRLPSGERIFVRLQTSKLLAVAPVREHRLTQTTERDLHLELVLDRPLVAAETEAMVEMLREAIHPALQYRVQQVARIDWGPSPKRQDLVSLV